MSCSRVVMCPAALCPAPSQCACESTGVLAAFKGRAAVGCEQKADSRSVAGRLPEGGRWSTVRSVAGGSVLNSWPPLVLCIRYQHSVKSVFLSHGIWRRDAE